jgi:three-Cys-motif partner protein
MSKKPDRWPELCELVKVSDALPTRDAGSWTEDKLWFWNRYIDITTSAMVGHPKWPEGLVYVDLFAGPGVCEIRRTAHRFPGSALIAANAPKPFRSILLCELDNTNAVALESRMESSPAKDRFRIFRDDCNKCIHDIVKEIPAGSLTVAFIDPEALHIHFETIRALARCGQVDLLILFADRMDIVRNVDLYYQQKNSNLDRMFGPGSIWRGNWENLTNRTPENICKLFVDEYKSQLRQLGYLVFGEQPIGGANGPLYRLIYASKHSKGLEFWDKVRTRDRSGQSDLFGPT